MIVRFLPDTLRINPYLDLLAAGLAAQGVAVHRASFPYLTPDWLVRHRNEVDVLHLHWIHDYHQRASLPASLMGALYLASQLLIARRLGYGLVWTIHNLSPHEEKHPRLDTWMRQKVLRWSRPVVHCNAAAEAVRQVFRYTDDIHVAPLGNYVGVYPKAPYSKPVARHMLELPARSTLLLHIGTIRPYKAIPELARQFAELPYDNVALVIAGEERSCDLLATLPKELRNEERLILRLRWLSEDELSLYLAAADAVVTAFERVLTSSSIMLALSSRLPVVAPALRCIPGLVQEAGILYDPADPRGLYEALVRCTQVNLAAVGQKGYEIALSHTWSQTAAAVNEAYEKAKGAVG